MSCAAKPISTISTMATTIFNISPSSILTHQHQPISTPLKPITLHLSNPSLKSLSLHKKTQPFSRFSRFTRFSSLGILESSQDDDLSKSYLTLQKDDDQEEEDVRIEIENERDDIVISGESDDVSGGDGDVSGEVEDEEEEVVVQPLEEAKIFVGNLPYDVDSEQLAALFQQAGVVDIVEVIYNRETDQSRGFGFVTMNTVEEAEKAVEMLHRYELGGRYLTVNKAAPKGSRPERVERSPQNSGPSYRVYVGNLPWDVDDVRLEQLFSEHGKVVDARVVYDRDSGRSRGFGFVTMSSESELNDAIENLDGQSMGGRALRVNVAEEKPRRY